MAVAYDEAYYVGQVTAIMSEEEMEINFLAQSHVGSLSGQGRRTVLK